MMTPRKRATLLILIIVAIILFIVSLLFFLFGRSKTDEQNTPEALPALEQPVSSPTITSQILKEENDTRNNSSNLIAFSKLFTERYGSYSNEANFQNIRDVIPLMSSKFAKSTEAFLLNKKAPDTFYGVTTRVITVKVIDTDDKAGLATIKMTTQREEDVGSAQNTTVKYQDIELKFVKELDVWKVDSATWL